MPLAAGISSFATELEDIEKVGFTSTGEAADAFASAFANFFGYATLTGVPITIGTNMAPPAIAACAGGLIPAFTIPNTPTSSSLAMQVAFLAYMTAGPLSAMWPSLAASVAPTGPTLDTHLVPVMVPGIVGPKIKLATGIMNWIMTGAQITLSIGGTAFIV